jgi:cytochrome c556
MMRTVARFCASAALMALATGALAHEGATGVTKERMDDMEEMGRATKRINERLKAGRDLAAIAADARTIQTAAQRFPSLFPPDSADGHSDAKAAVWERWPAFVEAAQALEREADKLEVVARTGARPEVAAQFRAVNAACTACHDAFRSKH